MECDLVDAVFLSGFREMRSYEPPELLGDQKAIQLANDVRHAGHERTLVGAIVGTVCLWETLGVLCTHSGGDVAADRA
jgi:hypothetical protein